jgi:hypothetical protein
VVGANSGSVLLLHWSVGRPSQSMSRSAFQNTASGVPQTGTVAALPASVRKRPWEVWAHSPARASRSAAVTAPSLRATVLSRGGTASAGPGSVAGAIRAAPAAASVSDGTRTRTMRDPLLGDTEHIQHTVGRAGALGHR